MPKKTTKAVKKIKKVVRAKAEKPIKKNNVVAEEKETEKVLDPDLLLDDEGAPIAEEIDEEEEDEDSELLDSDEVDPFKDKWEE